MIDQPTSAEHISNITAAAVGSPDFCRRVTAVIVGRKLGITTVSGGLSDAWSLVLTHRPNLVFIEMGIQHSERHHVWVRRFLSQVRERFDSEIAIVIALSAPEKLSFGGDLLFGTETDFSPSRFVDTYIAMSPGSIPSIPSLGEQVIDVIRHFSAEFDRRTNGKVALPQLGADGWVQSLADPRSRTLWMRWLPRFAGYTNENPIIIGQTGTGKTNLAYAIHLLSGREGKFISITPRDFSSSELVQAELFGAVSGAYTGAVDKWGLVKSAEKGTLFIDELQSIDKDLQGKLITFIENKAYRRVGSAESIDADVRFVFASNKTLHDMMAHDILRHDFAYRLERVQLELPSLSQRRLDIAAALAYALAKIHRQRRHATPVTGLNSAAFRMLFAHDWPGNLRQLENTIAQLCEISDMKNSAVIDESAVTHVFESKLYGTASTTSEIISKAALKLAHHALASPLDSMEAGLEQFLEMVRTSALEATGGDIAKASLMVEENPRVMELFARAAEIRADSHMHEEDPAVKLLSLSEFQSLTGISDGALVRLLTKIPLECRVDPQKGIVIDVDAVQTKTIIEALVEKEKKELAGRERLIAERIGALIGEQFEEIAREAISQFLSSQERS